VANKTATKDELAKQVCAFANSGGGFLVYGLAKGGGFDAGVSELVNDQPAKAWVEQIIPQLVFPPITDCEALFCHLPNHAQGKGILAVSIKPSELRPHWCKQGGQEVSFIRCGEHSDPMRPQTFLDIRSRTSTSKGELVSLGPMEFPSSDQFVINPVVKLLIGTVCEKWCLVLKLPRGSEFDRHLPENARRVTEREIVLSGHSPLFPNLPVRAATSHIVMRMRAGPIKTTLCVGSAEPVEREITIGDLVSEATLLTKGE
jgi:hypothetical protein